MDHDETRDRLELAAAEPGGLERLMAGDTPEAMAVAAHLVGCASCTLELERIRRASAVIRDVVATTPPPELRERTLAHVRAHGRPRGEAPPAGAPVLAAGSPAAGSPAAPAGSPAAQAPVAAPLAPPTSISMARDRRRAALGWLAAVAAAVALSVIATSFIVGGRIDDRLALQDQQIEHLADVTTATLHLAAEPDVDRVALSSPTGAGIEGTLLFSPKTTQLVVVATGLTEPATGMEYRCWVMTGATGARQTIGKMFFGGGLAYWVGPSSAIAELPADARFGVSLVSADGSTVGTDPVLSSGS
jgi:hypothetical protein